ncbi:MAG: DUF819 family protein [Bacteroidota bacterium]
MSAAYVLMVLCLIVVISEVLVRTTWLRHVGTALLVIVVTAVAANLGVVPAGSPPDAPVIVYEGIFAYLAPLSIFWLLLQVNLRDVLQAGLPMLSLFLIGAVGTAAGVVLGMWVIDGAEVLGTSYAALGGMFVGTYTGGSVNFNALALNYGVMRDGALYGGAVAVDNIMTAVWMVATLGLPRLLAPLWARSTRGSQTASSGPLLGVREDTEAVHPVDLGLAGALGFGALWGSDVLAELTGIPSVLLLTTFALVLAQIPAVARRPGARVLGLFAVYLFLAVIGAFCEVAALQSLGSLGPTLLLFTAITVGVHGLVTYGAARLLRLDLVMTSVASQANVGGATSALALARSLGRSDLVLPAVLLGSLGLAVGTFLGFWVAEAVLPLLA